jgi:hypothetical protein
VIVCSFSQRLILFDLTRIINYRGLIWDLLNFSIVVFQSNLRNMLNVVFMIVLTSNLLLVINRVEIFTSSVSIIIVAKFDADMGIKVFPPCGYM